MQEIRTEIWQELKLCQLLHEPQHVQILYVLSFAALLLTKLYLNLEQSREDSIDEECKEVLF